MGADYRTHELNDFQRAKISVLYSVDRPQLPDLFHTALGEAKLDCEPLPITEFNDAIVEFGRFTKCLYDREGNRVAASTLVRNEESGARMWNAVERLESIEVTNSISGPVLYQSPVIDHWGHFVLETMSRTWAAREFPDLVENASLFPMNRRQELPEVLNPGLSEILALNGFAQIRIDPPASRVRIAKCFVPAPSFVLGPGGRAHIRHLDAPRRAAERLSGVRRRDSRPIYLSRSKVSGEGIRREFVNEPDLQARLESAGVRIVHMQDLPLAAQVELINTHDVFIGAWGSAFHNIVFCLPGHAITTFMLIGMFAPSDYLMVNAIVGNDAHYLAVVRPVVRDGVVARLEIDIDATIDYLRDRGVI